MESPVDREKAFRRARRWKICRLTFAFIMFCVSLSGLISFIVQFDNKVGACAMGIALCDILIYVLVLVRGDDIFQGIKSRVPSILFAACGLAHIAAGIYFLVEFIRLHEGISPKAKIVPAMLFFSNAKWTFFCAYLINQYRLGKLPITYESVSIVAEES